MEVGAAVRLGSCFEPELTGFRCFGADCRVDRAVPENVPALVVTGLPVAVVEQIAS
jgi:hypothetical protein